MFRGKKLIEEVENPPTDAKERIELGLFDNSDDHVSQRIKKKKKSSEGLCFISVKKKHTHTTLLYRWPGTAQSEQRVSGRHKPRFLAGTSQRWATGRCLRGNPPALISSPGPSRLESRRDFLTGEQELSYVNSVKVSVFLDALFLGSRGSLCSL